MKIDTLLFYMVKWLGIRLLHILLHMNILRKLDPYNHFKR